MMKVTTLLSRRPQIIGMSEIARSEILPSILIHLAQLRLSSVGTGHFHSTAHPNLTGLVTPLRGTTV